MEAVFGQMKANRRCKRFRHIGRDKILMDFAIFAIAFNMGKMFSRNQNTKRIAGNGSKKSTFFMDDCSRGDKSERNTKNKVPDESTPRLRRLIQKKRLPFLNSLLPDEKKIDSVTDRILQFKKTRFSPVGTRFHSVLRK
jgi:hypothetical protein